ncbi:retrovirus-related Pol polyprotein from transposon 412 [Trichonephila clavipes]|nr:retrovirus-related Pol polyprotein from transposon 412 [Trichonephila clavipes]
MPSTLESNPLNEESIRKDQLADPEIKPIIEFKQSPDEKPSWQDIASFHPKTKRYCAFRDSPSEKECFILKRVSENGKAFRWQLKHPHTSVSTILNELHEVHFGVMKTLQKFREHFYWNNMWSDVEKWCRT